MEKAAAELQQGGGHYFRTIGQDGRVRYTEEFAEEDFQQYRNGFRERTLPWSMHCQLRTW